MVRRLISIFAFVCVFPAMVNAEAFKVSDIRVEGLQRISVGIVSSALPFNLGDDVDEQIVAETIRSLFATGFFSDIKIGRDGDILVVVVVERPSIESIKIDGNKAIKTDQLIENLTRDGIEEGRVLQRAAVERLQLGLTQVYSGQGRYDAGVDVEIIKEDRNRVKLKIEIDEGNPASIKHINIVGNTLYGDEDIIQGFELRTTGWFSFISNDDKYSREKLTGDLETLESYYLDRGHRRFSIESAQVSITPDKKHVYITISVNEGDKYTIRDVELAGDLVDSERFLKMAVQVEKGQVFSNKRITDTSELMTKILSNQGYTFAEVEGVTEVHEEDKTVSVTLLVKPGKRTYVRRITFKGNTETVDEVLRRELVQLEGAPASNDNIEFSKVKLERLGFFEEVEVETNLVPGTTDQVDVEYSVKEKNFGNFEFQFGHSAGLGFIFGFNLQQRNFLGTGKTVGTSINTNKYQKSLNLTYSNPYFTDNGISRGFNIFYRKSDYGNLNLLAFTTDTYGASMNFSYPIRTRNRKQERLMLNFGYIRTELNPGQNTVKEITASPKPIFDVDGNEVAYYMIPEVSPTFDSVTKELTDPGIDFDYGRVDDLSDPFRPFEEGFIEKNGNEFSNFTLTTGWSQLGLDRAIYPTSGTRQSLTFEMSMPGSDLEYYKVSYDGEYYKPLDDAHQWLLHLKSRLAFGDGYGDTTELPFFEHFYTGGINTVRGYRINTLGPRSTDADVYQVTSLTEDDLNELAYILGGDGKFRVDSVGGGVSDPNRKNIFGGNILVQSSAELIFPIPFLEDQSGIRTALFLDAGNIFSTNCTSTQSNCSDIDFGELRYSVGLSVSILRGFIPIKFVLAKPYNYSEFDRRETFQFSMSQGF